MKLTRKSYIVIVNALTLLRIPLAILFSLYLIKSKQAVVVCTIIFLLVAISDIADGKLARRYGVASSIGARLDVWCDFFFILISCLSLCYKNKMVVLIPIIIALKFVEFLVTSHWSKRNKKRQGILYYDPFGRVLAILFYCLPIFALVFSKLFEFVQIGLVITIAIASLLSTRIRIKFCFQNGGEQDFV